MTDNALLGKFGGPNEWYPACPPWATTRPAKGIVGPRWCRLGSLWCRKYAYQDKRSQRPQGFMESNRPLMNLGAYAYEPAPAARTHRALGAPSWEGQVFHRASHGSCPIRPRQSHDRRLRAPEGHPGSSSGASRGDGSSAPSPLATFIALLVALQSREDLDRGHKGSPGNVQGGGRSPKRRPKFPMGQRIQNKGSLVPLGPMGLTRPHRLLMSQGPTGFWAYQRPVSPCQAF